MKIKNGPTEGTLHNPLFLVLLISTLLSPVLPGVCLLVIAVIAWWKRERGLFEFDVVAVTLLGLAAVAVVATFIHETPWGLVSILFFTIYFLVYQWMKQNLTVTHFYHGLSLMGIGGLGVVAIMIINRAGGLEFLPSSLAYFFGLESWKPTESLRSTGTSGNANLAAGLLVCLALICFYKVVAKGRILLRQRLFWAVVFGGYLVGFDLTGTRMAWVAVAIGAAGQLWFLYAPRIRRQFSQFHFSHVFFFTAVIGLLFMVKDWLPRKGSFNLDLALRVEIWERALHLFQHDWMFGVLPLHFGELFLAHFGQYEFHAHNLFIGMAVDFGIIGFTLFMCLLVTALIRGVQWIRWAHHPRERELAIVLMSFVFAYLGQGLADYTVLVPQTGWLFLMSLGFIHIRWLQLAPLQVRAVKRKVAHSAVNPLPK